MKKEKKIRSIRRTVLTVAPVALCVIILAIVIPGMLKKEDEKVVAHAKDLMNGIVSHKIASVDGMIPDDMFKEKYMSFALNFFKETLSENNDNSSVMVSPLSIYYAFAMAANGAEGSTKVEIENVLGLKTDALNRYLLAYADMLESSDGVKFNVANSIWINNDKELIVEEDFLQTNADYYDADIYEMSFDDSAISDINGWVNENTYGMIKEIINKIGIEDMLYIINAVAFEGEWLVPYRENQVNEGDFTNSIGETEKAEFMSSTTSSYIKDDNAIGFIKPYKGDYAFVAVLPNEGMTVEEYLETLTPESFIKLLKSKQYVEAHTKIPKFKCENTFNIGKILGDMGMADTFDPGNVDFTGIGTYDGKESLYISGAIQKTFIEVDEKGTKAAAVTAITMAPTKAVDTEKVEIYLDRPFVYAIIDTNTNLPLFIGTLMSVE